MIVFATVGQQLLLSGLFQLWSAFCFCQSKANLSSSLTIISLFYSSRETLEPTHFTPVSACTDYVVIAETMGQLNFHYLNDCDTANIAVNALAPR